VQQTQPLRFIDRELFPYLVKVTKLFAAHIDADPRDVVLVPNATTALNSVLQSVPLAKGEVVVFFDTTYASVKKMVRKVCHERGAVATEKTLPVLHAHLSPDALAHAIVGLMPDKCKVVILDHISSNEALLLPLSLLVPLMQARGALVLVDGAHGLAATTLSVTEVGADYYCGNCHKWFCAPRGVGFLHVNHARLARIAPDLPPAPNINVVACSTKTCERIGVIKTTAWGGVDNPITSHGYGAGFLSQYVWDGARDYSALLAIETCLVFWARLPCALGYSQALVGWATAFLVARYLHTICASLLCLALLPNHKHPFGGRQARIHE